MLFSGSLKVIWEFFHEIFWRVRSSWSWVRIVGTLFARKLAVMRASLPPSWCFTERFSAMTEIFLVWLKNSMYGCCSSIFSLFAASLGVHFCPKTRVWWVSCSVVGFMAMVFSGDRSVSSFLSFLCSWNAGSSA